MTYDYQCACGYAFEVVKPMAESSREEPCANCGCIAVRKFTPVRGIVKNFEADYYPSLGKVFNTKKELDYHLDKNNLVPCGNDFGSGEKMIDAFEKDRQRKIEKSWERL